MNTAGPDPRPWPRSRWYLVIALVFAGQIGLIFAFGDRKPAEPRRVAFVSELRLATAPGDFLALSDPTLFALPSAHGFSAEAWLEAPPVRPPAFEWSETNRWLWLPLEDLGSTLMSIVQTNLFPQFTFEAMPPPQWHDVTNESAVPAQTSLRVDGDLARRQLLERPELPVVPLADLLQASTVQVFVDEAGNVVTTALLPPGSGSDKADQQALDLAKGVRFAPLPHDADAPPHWTRGTLVFQWATAPVSTNAPAAAP